MPKSNDVCGGEIKSNGNGGGECSVCKVNYFLCMVGKICQTGAKKIVTLSDVVFGL